MFARSTPKEDYIYIRVVAPNLFSKSILEIIFKAHTQIYWIRFLLILINKLVLWRVCAAKHIWDLRIFRN